MTTYNLTAGKTWAAGESITTAKLNQSQTASSTSITNNLIGIASNTADYIPQWNGTSGALLKDGKEVVTAISGSSTDAQVPTAEAVEERIVTATTYPGISMYTAETVSCSSDTATLAEILIDANTFTLDYADSEFVTYSLGTTILTPSITIPATGRYNVKITGYANTPSHIVFQVGIGGSKYALTGIHPRSSSGSTTATADQGNLDLNMNLSSGNVISVFAAVADSGNDLAFTSFTIQRIPT